jgi:uncharacterized protein
MEILIGFLIAVVIGLTGVGGGVITAPVLILFLGVPPAEAVGTALLFVTIVKSLAIPMYLYRKQVNFRVLLYLIAGGIPGVLAGSLVLHRASTSGLNWLVLSIIGLTVAISASLNLIRFLFWPQRSKPAERLPLLAVLAGGIGLEVGFSSAGAGALGTLALMQFTPLSTAAVVGTDLLFGFVISAIGGGIHFVTGNFQAAVLIKLAAGGLFGAVTGAYFATIIPTRALRVALSAWLVFMGLHLCYHGFRARSAAATNASTQQKSGPVQGYAAHSKSVPVPTP